MKEEEEAFLRTLATGINLLEGVMAETKQKGQTVIDGRQAFTLFDTFGFPLDLTELICAEHGLSVDLDTFNEEMQKQKDRARNAAQVTAGDWQTVREGETQFVGWDQTEATTHILRYRRVEQKKKTFYELVLDVSPFYAEKGGQVGDSGVLQSVNETVKIVDTKSENNLAIHICNELPEHPEAEFVARVDLKKRHGSEANHTATHLLDQALRQVLGTHVEQKGSLVTPDYLRFDFSHFQKTTAEELRQVERLVNARIREDLPLDEHRDMPIDEARQMGAIALFGEKYGDRVRVVRFGDSVELCGGCHARSTGRIGLFRIMSESSVAARVRRIEAVTGQMAEESVYMMQDSLLALKELMNNAKDLPGAVHKALEDNAELKRQVEAYMKEKADSLMKRLLDNARIVNGVKVITANVHLPADVVKDMAFKLANDTQDSLLVVIGSVSDGKPLLTVMLSKDLVSDHGLNAGQMVREAAKLIQGGGGGAPHFATAGGKNPDGLNAAIEKVVELANL
jgi:alanyl-tRNA synthetase